MYTNIIKDNCFVLKLFFPYCKVKRFQLPQTLNEVHTLVQLNLKEIQSYSIYYYINNNEHIEIESQNDYEKVIELFSKSNSSKILKLYIKESNMKRPSKKHVNIDLHRLYHSFNYIMKCPLCYRQFANNNSYIKHAKSCFSVFGMKRAPFNSKEQRLGHNQVTINMRINYFKYLIEKEFGKTHTYNWRTLSTTFRNLLHKWKQHY